MDIAKTRELLDKIPSRTDYEFRNFEIESQGSWHRQMRYALRQKESLADAIDKIAAEIELAEYTVSRIVDTKEQAIQARIVAANNNQLNRDRSDLVQQMAQVDAWLDVYDDSEFEDVIRGMELNEGDSWSETLGREIGVEVLTDKQASKSSLMQASMLPLADYKKSVIITNQFAGFLKKTAEQAENSVAVNRPPSMPTQAPEVLPDAVAEMAELRDKMFEAVEAASDADSKEKKKKKKKK
jgi:hypothetical protein